MTARLIYDPSSAPLRYACGVSGSGSNYEKIHAGHPEARHVVFSNVPDCAGLAKARNSGAPAVASSTNPAHHAFFSKPSAVAWTPSRLSHEQFPPGNNRSPF